MCGIAGIVVSNAVSYTPEINRMIQSIHLGVPMAN